MALAVRGRAHAQARATIRFPHTDLLHSHVDQLRQRAGWQHPGGTLHVVDGHCV
ncbi:hypothetical protein T492DRAFT_1064733 [Pavlovales sp. CCMP2436]|nr:hypothetical protein T492DRAFT_1064733 [Pavlovales sp. CCMP2436]